MNTNPIEELRQMETPVSEEGWASIVNDRRYARKFGRKDGLSPKGRAAIIGGAAAVLITVPILVKTLTHSTKETAQTTVPATETMVEQDAIETVAYQIEPETPETAIPVASTQDTTIPARVTSTGNAANHEASTMASAVAKRQQNTVNQSREDWPPVVCPEPDGSRLTYDKLKTNPARSDTTGLHTGGELIRTVYGYPHDQNVSSGISETTVTADGQVTTKYEYNPEEPAAETEQFFIPSAFTPNGDGLNDLFLVKANFEPKSFEVTVLNRGGEMMFISRDINIGWDGQLHGKLMPQGVYVCIIKYKDSQGVEHKQQGQVLLIP